MFNGIEGECFVGLSRLFHCLPAHSACLQIFGSHDSIHAIGPAPSVYGKHAMPMKMNVLPFLGGVTGVELSRGVDLSTLWYWLPFVVVPLRLPPLVRAAVWATLIVLLIIFSTPSVTTVAASASISFLASRSYIPSK